MDKDDLIRLRANYQYLVDHLHVTSIKAELYQVGVLNVDDLERLDTSKDRKAAGRLLTILPRKANNSFTKFCEALRNNDHDFVADKLLSTSPADHPELQAEDEVDFTIDNVTNSNMQTLRDQLRIQAEELRRYQQKMDALQKTLTGQEQESAAIRQKLEQAMKMTSHPAGDDINYLQDYVARSGVSQTDRRSRPLSGSLTDPIARALGIDIVNYMTASVLNKPSEQPNHEYAITMRRTVRELAMKHRNLFNGFIANFETVDGCKTLANVADEMFSDGSVNWGRIVVLYAFSGSLARYCAREDYGEDTVDMIADFLGFYVSKKLGPWIDQHNGWGAFVEQFAVKNATETSNMWTNILKITAVSFTAAVNMYANS